MSSLKSKPENLIGQWHISREGREHGEGSRWIVFANFAVIARHFSTLRSGTGSLSKLNCPLPRFAANSAFLCSK